MQLFTCAFIIGAVGAYRVDHDTLLNKIDGDQAVSALHLLADAEDADAEDADARQLRKDELESIVRSISRHSKEHPARPRKGPQRWRPDSRRKSLRGRESHGLLARESHGLLARESAK
ncbi:MAG: uncharacterized protein KVP18_002439 [Porospora cf. gigantea A]|uniref:uncharacterized protein n=1 Tax=Porospora cf. gigantea A TaxID=2853593 RepID=UPI00355A6214|nr:MAG: hypothetical protein KVP18_002439 [Porospora cf. gigantea A]